MGKHAHFDVSRGASWEMLLSAFADLDAKIRKDTNCTDSLMDSVSRRMTSRSQDEGRKCSEPTLFTEKYRRPWSDRTRVRLHFHHPMSDEDVMPLFYHRYDSETVTEDWLSFAEFMHELRALELGSATTKRAKTVVHEMNQAHERATGYSLSSGKVDGRSFVLMHRNEMAELLWFLTALEELECEEFSCSALPITIQQPLEAELSYAAKPEPVGPSPYIMNELLIGMAVCEPANDAVDTMSALLVATLKSLSMGKKRPDLFLPTGIGYGHARPDQLGTGCVVLVGESTSAAATPAITAAPNAETMTHLEANIDDATGEALALAIELLLKKGAADAWVAPIVMKKGRPAHTLHCLSHSDSALVDALLGIFFRQTTTLGVRVNRSVERVALKRRLMNVKWKDDNGVERTTRVKVGYYQDSVVSVKPEFEDLKKIVLETGMPLKEASDKVIAEVYADLGKFVS
uniref:Uncharacterized protein n=1 Tax=Grammatophora oceanica TaxID=210454 RepID=A0A7S1Y3L7_9STRA|mmetsp:Transcript_17483/g.25868  ORF Transcript_17483/g.25868 Transcript_17483/m.25868 type:complete len:460 (+) Transcript_17483:130-1509(+)